MKNIKTLTVVITNHNRPKIILPVIDSIITQPLKDIDLDILIIDDASTSPIDPDDLKKYGDKVKLHRLDKNRGLHGARNAGIFLAKGDFIVIADDDDPFFSNTLQNAINFITSLADYKKYPMFQFAITNSSISGFYTLVNEGHFFKKLLKGDFIKFINKKVFLKNGFLYPEYESLRKISCEMLLFAEVAYRFGIPTWNYKIIKYGDEDTTVNRLTNPKNWLRKAKQFANLQKLEMQYMEQRGFDKKYPQYYQFKIKGLYIYLLLDNRKKEAKEVLKKQLQTNKIVKFLFLLLSYLPISIVNWLLIIYRKRLF